MKKSKYTDGQILVILKQAKAGTPVPALCREHGISSANTCLSPSKKFKTMQLDGYGFTIMNVPTRLMAVYRQNKCWQ